MNVLRVFCRVFTQEEIAVKKILNWIVLCVGLAGCKEDSAIDFIRLLHMFVGDIEVDHTGGSNTGLPRDRTITLVFSSALNAGTVGSSVRIFKNGKPVTAEITLSPQTTITIFPDGILESNTTYTISIGSDLKGAQGESVAPAEVIFTTAREDLQLVSGEISGRDIGQSTRLQNIPVEPDITLNFSLPVNEELFAAAASISGSGEPGVELEFSDEGKTVTITSSSPLDHLSRYELELSDGLKGQNGESFDGFSKTFYTEVDETPKFPVVTDEELLTLVQRQTFRYFWDFAQPTSGMARERNTSADLVTSGGSGFGLMAIIVGIERNFISRQAGIERLETITGFLETADRFHGAWSHWIDGNNGNVIPFSSNDNGGDLVETSYLVQGLLTFRQYLDPGAPAEQDLINRINALWGSVEWDWYTREGQDVLYWHWSPDKEWIMNHPIQGYNECLITYVLAASSPGHSIAASVYSNGWARNGNMQNGNEYYDISLPLGPAYGGPLFFAHYSYLGLDPRSLSDSYADYWIQNVSHARINYEYCVANPMDYVGYSDQCWGLTASDNRQGYSAHSPTNDPGVVTPTAALSSFPYTPTESMHALKFFYYTLGDRLWGEYGFVDAFNITDGWYADSYLAIDQGPVIVMIENYRTGLLWNLFMSCPEVQDGLNKLEFSY